MSTREFRFRRPEQAEARFWGKVQKSATCWEWQAAITTKGYGQFAAGFGPVLAHRMAWVFVNGAIPDNLCVLHKCDNRKCVRPDHLFLGTIADNNRDMGEKGRQVGWSYKRYSSRLTHEQVAEIKSLAGSKSHRAIAALFGISQSHVGRIIRGEFTLP